MLPTAEAPGTQSVGRTSNLPRIRLVPRADNVGMQDGNTIKPESPRLRSRVSPAGHPALLWYTIPTRLSVPAASMRALDGLLLLRLNTALIASYSWWRSAWDFRAR